MTKEDSKKSTESSSKEERVLSSEQPNCQRTRETILSIDSEANSENANSTQEDIKEKKKEKAAAFGEENSTEGKKEKNRKKIAQRVIPRKWISIELIEDRPLLSKELLKLFFATSFFNFGYNFVTTAEYVHFKDILRSAGLTSESVIALLTAVSLVALCFGAMVGGGINDTVRTKYGQRVPSIFIGGLIFSIFILIIPLVTQLISNVTTIFILLLIIFIISHLALGAALAPWLALVSDLFKKDERAWAGIAINVFGAGGAAIALLVFSVLIENNLHWVVWIITGTTIAISATVTVLLIPKENPPFEPDGKVKDVWRIPKVIWKFGGRTWPLILLVNTLWSFGSHLIETGVVDSLVERFPDTEATKASLGYLVMGIYGVLLAIPLTITINKIGKVQASMLASLIYGVFCFSLATMRNFNAIYYVGLFGGAGNLLMSTLQIALPADVVPRGREASFMGVFFVFGTFIKPIASLVQGPLLDIGGIENISLKTFGGYPWIFLFAGISCIIAIALLAYVNYEKLLGEEYIRFRNRLLLATHKITEGISSVTSAEVRAERRNKRQEKKTMKRNRKKA